MKTLALLAAFALVAGCASAPPPAPAAPTHEASSTPDWVAQAAATSPENDFQLANTSPAKAKASGDDTAAPATQLKVDNASGFDVKHAHLNSGGH